MNRSLPATPTPCRVLVFDLDDTLIDTHGVLLDHAHRRAAAAMIEAGASGSIDDVLALRHQLFNADPRGDLERTVARALGLEGEVLEAVAQAGRLTFHRPAMPAEQELALPGARTMLRRLARDFTLILLTRGDPPTQAAKLRKAQLADAFEQRIFVPLESTKSAALTGLLERLGCQPNEVVVIGDRPDQEIRAGTDLGCWTIRLRRGEFAAIEPTAMEQPHATVSNLRELQDILLAHFVAVSQPQP
jgi:putative hydrolase of the HAD superfamily